MYQQLSDLLIKQGGWIMVVVAIALGLWSLFWKYCAVWTAAKRGQKWWLFIVLILNTVGILEIIYIFFVAKKKWSDIKEIFSKIPTIQ